MWHTNDTARNSHHGIPGGFVHKAHKDYQNLYLLMMSVRKSAFYFMEYQNSRVKTFLKQCIFYARILTCKPVKILMDVNREMVRDIFQGGAVFLFRGKERTLWIRHISLVSWLIAGWLPVVKCIAFFLEVRLCVSFSGRVLFCLTAPCRDTLTRQSFLWVV